MATLDAPTVQALTTVAGASVLCIVLVEVIKRAWQPTSDQMARFLPIISILIGVAIVLVADLALGLMAGTDLLQGVVTGIFAGLAASGAYDTARGIANR